jgi:3-oxoadipate enol-lactonase
MPHLQADDVTIWHEQFGTGPDILWIPGGDQPGSDWHEYQVPCFAGRYRNTTYDPRGIGRTGAPPSSNWTIEAHAADAAAVIRAVCAPPVNVVGLSMGSLVVQELCLSYPELVRCGIAMGTSAKADGYLSEWMTAEVEFRRGGGELPEDFAVTHYGVFMYPSEVLGDAELWSRVRPIVAGAYGKRSGGDLAAQWQGCIDYDSVPRLPGCKVPLHVIGFSHDVQAPPALGRQVAQLVPQGAFHLLEGLGHCSAFGHRPDEVNACIADILEQHAP